MASSNLGSSPLARGTRAWPPGSTTWIRLIPARAGNTRRLRMRRSRRRAHPRSRGEHPVSFTVCGSSPGSSPLARGTLSLQPPGTVILGLIPARAGNTRRPDGEGIHRWAHPRSRGEHRLALAAGLGCRGSSPLARGTLTFRTFFATNTGLIPARAGNTNFTAFIANTLWAHPRSRGEHRRVHVLTFVLVGSSPLARGTRDIIIPETFSLGLIPARAGNTFRRRRHNHPGRAHPRSRGEHTC